MENNKTVVCFGEMLWDLLPTGKIPGGAPMNVAVHLNNFGINANMISRVGEDALGAEIVQFLQSRSINTNHVQTDTQHPTSVVKVDLRPNNEVHYEIVEDIAWDYIEYNQQLDELVESADVLAFCSLACRNDVTFETFKKLLPKAKLASFDVNLRPPFYTKGMITEMLKYADIVKMNREELFEIGGWHFEEADEFKLAELVRQHFNIQKLCITRGKHGAMLYTDNGGINQKGFLIVVQDTVGSGDSFIAAFIAKMLNGASDAEALEFACATGSLVATYRGAVPKITAAEVQQLIDSQKE